MAQTNLIQIAAFLYAMICMGTVVFQFCMIAGAPWGRLTQGGSHQGPLPKSGRIVAGASVFLLTAMGLAILSAAGIWPDWPIWTGWATVAVQVLSTVLNLITPSVAERRLWGPVTLVMLVLALTVMVAA